MRRWLYGVSTLAAAVLWLAFWLVPDAQIGDRVLLTSLGAAALVLPAWRAACDRVMRSESFSKLAVVLGSGELARSCAALIRKDGEVLGLRLAGRLVRDGEPIEEAEIVGRYRDLRRLVDAAGRDVRQVVASHRDEPGVGGGGARVGGGLLHGGDCATTWGPSQLGLVRRSACSSRSPARSRS